MRKTIALLLFSLPAFAGVPRWSAGRAIGELLGPLFPQAVFRALLGQPVSSGPSGVIQSAVCTNKGGSYSTSIACPAMSGVGAGHAVIVFATGAGIDTSGSTNATGGGTYTGSGSKCTYSNVSSRWLWTLNATGGSTTVTINAPNGLYLGGIVMEVSGVTGIDFSNNCGDGSYVPTTFYSSAYTTAHAAELLISAWADCPTSGITPNSPYAYVAKDATAQGSYVASYGATSIQTSQQMSFGYSGYSVQSMSVLGVY